MQHILNYERSTLVDAKYDNQKQSISFPAQYLYNIGKCEENTCIIDAGYLAPGKMFPLKFFGKDKSSIEVVCSGLEEKIELFQ